MTFRNDKQRGLACAALTRGVARGPYWAPNAFGEARPTEAACRVLAEVLVERGRDRDDVEEYLGVSLAPVPLSDSERTLVLLAWDVWSSGHDAVTAARLLYTLDRANLGMVASLLIAIAAPSSSAIDVWLAAHRSAA